MGAFNGEMRAWDCISGPREATFMSLRQSRDGNYSNRSPGGDNPKERVRAG